MSRAATGGAPGPGQGLQTQFLGPSCRAGEHVDGRRALPQPVGEVVAGELMHPLGLGSIRLSGVRRQAKKLIGVTAAEASSGRAASACRSIGAGRQWLSRAAMAGFASRWRHPGGERAAPGRSPRRRRGRARWVLQERRQPRHHPQGLEPFLEIEAHGAGPSEERAILAAVPRPGEPCRQGTMPAEAPAAGPLRFPQGLLRSRRQGHQHRWHHSTVTRAAGPTQRGHRSAILWFTGLSGAGKSTLAKSRSIRPVRAGAAVVCSTATRCGTGCAAIWASPTPSGRRTSAGIGEVAKLFLVRGGWCSPPSLPLSSGGPSAGPDLVEEGDFLEIHATPICRSARNATLRPHARARAGRSRSSPASPATEPPRALSCGSPPANRASMTPWRR